MIMSEHSCVWVRALAAGSLIAGCRRAAFLSCKVCVCECVLYWAVGVRPSHPTDTCCCVSCLPESLTCVYT